MQATKVFEGDENNGNVDELKSVFSIGDFLKKGCDAANGIVNMRRDSNVTSNTKMMQFDMPSPRVNKQLMVCLNCGKI